MTELAIEVGEQAADLTGGALERIAGGSLTLDAIERRFGDTAAVAGVSLVVNSGEFVSLLGPSGSGKTTTLSIIAGLEKADGGHVVLDGVDITSLPPNKRNVGVVFQSYALFPHMTVTENLAYPLKARKMSRHDISARIGWALRLVRLEGYEKRYPRELSGGQQQRVAFARAVIYGPRLLLMDEPLSALDRKLRDELQGEIRALHKNLGMTVVYVTHDQGEALSLSDRVVVMRAGLVEQIGTPQEIYERPSSEFVARFVGNSNFLRGQIDGPVSTGGVARVALKGDRIALGVSRVPLEGRTDVQVLIRPEHLRVGQPPADWSGSFLDLQVTDHVYQGNFVLCLGMFETGEPCRLHLAGEDATELIREGKGTVWWRPEDGVVLPVE